MPKYNTGIKYNLKAPNGGGMYNSAPYLIIIIDSGSGNDDITYFLANINILETGVGQDFSNIAKVNLLVDSDNTLQPLGVMVLRDSRQDLLPSTKEENEEIPGRHGEINLETKFQPRILELHVASLDGLTASEKESIKRTFSKYLNPVQGTNNLAFSNDLEKMYLVKYAGKIDLTQYADWMEFVIPFKMANPYIVGAFENLQVGSGTLTNAGNIEAPLTISIVGPITNPSITIGSSTLSYTGTISAGQTLVIDTGKTTVKLAGVNVFNNYNRVFPKLQPGDTNVTASNQVTFIWRNRWI